MFQAAQPYEKQKASTESKGEGAKTISNGRETEVNKIRIK